VDDETYETPEEAALAGWVGVPDSQATVTECRIDGDRAYVVVETVPRHREKNQCVRTSEGRWYVASSGGSLRTSDTPTADWARPIKGDGQ
jgi:hypothetical protein